jgi:hypothetical protein
VVGGVDERRPSGSTGALLAEVFHTIRLEGDNGIQEPKRAQRGQWIAAQETMTVGGESE